MASTAYNSASVIIPKGAGYKASTIYGWRPSVNILQSIGITRNDANGSFRNQQGLIEFAAANVPRFNWDEGDGCPKLLVEPSRENLITYSEQFDNAAWTKTQTTITANVISSPDGTVNADLVTRNGVNENDRIAQTATVVNATEYTASFYIKNNDVPTGVNDTYLSFRVSGGTLFRAGFRWNPDGSVTYNSSASDNSGTFTANVTDMKLNGWYQIAITFTTDGTSGDIELDVERNTTTETTSIYAWGAQLEAGSYATSYIKTEATTQTRAADVISQTGLASLIGDSEGTLYVEAEVFDTSTNNRLSLNAGSANNSVFIASTSSGQAQFASFLGGLTEVNISGGTITANTSFKIAGGYALNNFSLYLDGSNIGSDSSANTYSDGTLTDIKLNQGDGGNPFYGKISVLAWWQARLDNDVLESLTSYETYEEMAATLDYTID